MLGLFARARRKAPTPRKASFRPSLESLEARDCPSCIYLNATVSPSSMQVTLLGGVYGGTPGQQVNISGVVTGTVTTDANGYFTKTLPATGQGTAYAATADGQSNIAQAGVTDSAATISEFYGSDPNNNIWTFTGTVGGGYTGEVVTFSGLHSVEGKTATVYQNPDGGNYVFRYTVQLDGTQDDKGMIYVQGTDAWGVQSNETDYAVD